MTDAVNSTLSGPGEAPKQENPLPVWFWPVVLMVVGTVAAYWPIFSAGFIWDDDAYVTENPLLTAPDGWWRIWFSAHSQSQYFPLVYSTLRCEYALWGLDPVGYHAVNVGLHIINALLIGMLLQRLALPGAWLAAAVFALHPVQVETVGWVTELKNTESTLFYLLAIFAWLRFCAGAAGKFYWLALALQALALLAKTTACTLPAALLLALWLKNEPVTRRRVLQALPFLCLGFGMGLLSVWWEKHLGNYEPRFQLLGGPVDRLLIATRAVWFYAGKIIWPAPLTFSYPHWNIQAGDWRQFGWLAGGLGVVVVLWRGWPRWGKWPVAAVLFFVAALSPMLGFIPLYTFYFSYVADHYQYLACLGLIALLAGLLTRFFDGSAAGRALRLPVTAVILGVLGWLTWQQCHIYRNLETLWTDTLAKNPQCWMAHVNLGRLLAQQGNVAEAEAHYQQAQAINPAEDSTYYNYGNLLTRDGRLDAAAAQYRRALEINPGKAEAHNNLGIVLNRQHHPDQAIAEYEAALYYKPDYAEACYNLGNALSAEHRMDAAVAAYQRAVQLAPESERFRQRLEVVTGSAHAAP